MVDATYTSVAAYSQATESIGALARARGIKKCAGMSSRSKGHTNASEQFGRSHFQHFFVVKVNADGDVVTEGRGARSEVLSQHRFRLAEDVDIWCDGFTTIGAD